MRRLWPLLLFTASVHAQTPITITVTQTPATTTSTYSPNILKGGDNEGLWLPDDTGVVLDNLAAAMNAGFEPRQFRTVGDQFVNGTTTIGTYQPYYTYGGQQILPANYLAGWTYANRVSANGNSGQTRIITTSAPYPGQQANTVSGGTFSITSNVVTWAVSAPTVNGALTNGQTNFTVSGTTTLYSGLLLISANLPTGTTITSVSYSSGTTTVGMSAAATATVTGPISYSAIISGAVIVPSGYANTYLNGYLLTVTQVTGAAIQASGGGFTHANVGATTDTGFLTAQLAFTMPALPGATAAGDVYTLEYTEPSTPSTAWALGKGNDYTTCTASQIASDTSTPLDGSQSVRVNANCSVGSVFDNGIIQNGTSVNRFISLDGTYNGQVDARVESGSGAFNLKLYRALGGTLCSQNFTATGSKATYTFTSCTPAENSSTAITGAAIFQVTPIGGGTITFDNLKLNKTSGKSSNNNTAIRDEVIAAKQYGNGMSGTTIMPAGTTKVYSTQRDWLIEERSIQALMMSQLNAPQNWTGTPGNENPYNSPQLPDFIAQSYLVGAIPHFTIPCTARLDEAATYSQVFFSTNTSTGGGALRLAAGSAQPYAGPTGLFPKVILEKCDENWNDSFEGYIVPNVRPGAYTGLSDYAADTATFFAAMRADSSFIASAAVLMANQQYGVTSPYTDTNLQAPLPVMAALGGLPNGFTTASYWQSNYANFDNEADAWLAAQTEASVSGRGNVWFPSPTTALQALTCAGGVKCKVEIYETNNASGASCGQDLGAACGGAHSQPVTQTALQAIQAGAGAAFVTASQIKSQTDAGYIATNQFGMSGFAASAFPFLSPLQNSVWGESIDMGGLRSYTDRARFGGLFSPRPTLIGRHLYNKAIIGQVVNLTNTAAKFNFAGDTSNGPIPSQSNVPIVLSQATYDGAGGMGLWISNTSQTTTYTVTFAGVGAPSGTCTTETLLPSSFNTLNDAAAGTVESGATAQVYTTTTTGVCPSTMTLSPRQMTTLNYSTISAPPATITVPNGAVIRIPAGATITIKNQ